MQEHTQSSWGTSPPVGLGLIVFLTLTVLLAHFLKGSLTAWHRTGDRPCCSDASGLARLLLRGVPFPRSPRGPLASFGPLPTCQERPPLAPLGKVPTLAPPHILP